MGHLLVGHLHDVHRGLNEIDLAGRRNRTSATGVCLESLLWGTYMT